MGGLKEKLKNMKFNVDKEKIKDFLDKYFQNKNDKLLEDLQELEKENPKDMRVKQKMADVYYRQGQIDEAIDKLTQIANHYEKEEFILKSIQTYKTLLKIRPDFVEVNLKLAGLFQKLGMIVEAANQIRIAINQYASYGNKEKAISLAQDLYRLDPSEENRLKIGEIYQNFGMTDEAVKEYEALAKKYRESKEYDKLLKVYELIMPHQPDNKSIIKDVCVLHLRKQNPERAVQIMEQYKLVEDPIFEDLREKAKLMMQALRKQKRKVSG